MIPIFHESHTSKYNAHNPLHLRYWQKSSKWPLKDDTWRQRAHSSGFITEQTYERTVAITNVKLGLSNQNALTDAPRKYLNTIRYKLPTVDENREA